MTLRERALVQEALDILRMLPTGIDEDGVDESDRSPEDATWHIGSMVGARLKKALGEVSTRPGSAAAVSHGMQV